MDRTAAAMLIAVQGMKVDPFDQEALKKATQLVLRMLSELDEAPQTQGRVAAGREPVYVHSDGLVRYADRAGEVWPGVIKLMKYLYQNVGRTVSVDEIKTYVLGSEERTAHAVYTLVGHIRNVLGPEASQIVQTRGGRGGGYVWNAAYELKVCD